MPLPRPKSNEKEGEFMGRCLHELKHEKGGSRWPDHPQRIAVCMRSWGKKDEKVSDEEIIRASESITHYITMAKKVGRSSVMRDLLNQERWNRNSDPPASRKAREILDSLSENIEWRGLSQGESQIMVGALMEDDVDIEQLKGLVGDVILDEKSRFDDQTFIDFDNQLYEDAGEVFNQCNGDITQFGEGLRQACPAVTDEQIKKLFDNFQSLVNSFNTKASGI